jgi:hypothetical protein
MDVMVFADWFSDALGSSCLVFILILMGIGWIVQSIGKAAGDALKSDAARDAARIGFWAWFLSDDD